MQHHHLPLSLDAFEQRRLVLALVVLEAFARETAAPAPAPRRVLRPSTGASPRPARGRRHVRPARSC
jgi:hypothetical protein